MTDKKPNLDRWDDFSGEFIKTDLVKFPFTIVPVSINSEYDEQMKPRLHITFSYNDRDWKMELNKTNQNFIRANNIVPKKIIGKKLTFSSIMVRNPSLNKQVPSFLLSKIE